jgi:hypothetical protein
VDGRSATPDRELGEGFIEPDLAELEDLWPAIPETVRASLLSLAKAAGYGHRSRKHSDA